MNKNFTFTLRLNTMKLLNSVKDKPKIFFKLLFYNFFFATLLVATIYGFLALFEIKSIIVDNEEVYGWKGFIIPKLFSPLITLMITFSVWLFYLIGNLLIRLMMMIIRND